MNSGVTAAEGKCANRPFKEAIRKNPTLLAYILVFIIPLAFSRLLFYCVLFSGIISDVPESCVSNREPSHKRLSQSHLNIF